MDAGALDILKGLREDNNGTCVRTPHPETVQTALHRAALEGNSNTAGLARRVAGQTQPGCNRCLAKSRPSGLSRSAARTQTMSTRGAASRCFLLDEGRERRRLTRGGCDQVSNPAATPRCRQRRRRRAEGAARPRGGCS